MTRNLLSAWPLLAALIVSITGCGQSGGGESVLRAGNGDEPEDLDPQITTGMPENNIIRALFEGLVRKDPETLEPIPGVAESWSLSDDGTVYTFRIRPDAKWSNGDPVTAADFVYSWQRALSPALANEYAYMLYPIKNAEAYHTGELDDFARVGVEATDTRVLSVELNDPTAYFLQLLDHHSMYPVHQATIEQFGAMDEPGTRWTRPGNLVGNGAFTLTDWEVNRVIRVAPNPHYWNAETVELDGVEFYPISDMKTAERMFRAGQLDVTLGGYLSPSKIVTYRKERPEQIQITPTYATYYYEFNTTREPFDEVKVRRALAMAIDRASIVKNVTRAGERTAHALTPPDPNGYQPPEGVSFDPERARQLLAEAGFPDGDGFPEFELLYNTLENHRRIAVAIQQMWKKHLNIDATLTNTEWKVYLNTRDNMEHDIARAGWVADYLDPNNFLDLMTSYNGNNDTGWSNPEYDRLIREANRTLDTDERFALFRRADQMLSEHMPVIPIFYYSDTYLVAERVKGWHNNLLKYHPYQEMSIVEP
jgi:oligopeptide transport system substrate-binding protein